MKESEIYQPILDIEEWDDYFAELKERLSNHLEELEMQLM